MPGPYFPPDHTHPDELRIHAPSRKLHLKHILGVPDNWDGHAGEALIVSTDEKKVDFAAVSDINTGKTRIDGSESEDFLGVLIDPNTMEVIGSVGSKLISVKDGVYIPTTGGDLTGNLNVAAGVTIDGVDISDIPANYAQLTTAANQIFQGHVIIDNDMTITGTLYYGSLGVDTAFTALNDTPSSYTGSGGYIVQVKGDLSGLEFVAAAGGAPHPISSHTDSSIAGEADNDFMVHNGATWANETPATARGSLGLGDSATKNTGTGAGDVAVGNHNHDTIYYTKTLLDSGQLDNRYYTETETDVLLNGKANVAHNHDISELDIIANDIPAIVPYSGSSSSSGLGFTVQDAIDNLDSRIDILEVGGAVPAHTHVEIDITDLNHIDSVHRSDEINPHNVNADQVPAILQYGGSSSSSGLGQTVQDAINILDYRIDDLELSPVVHNHVASDITDFDIEVSNNIDVSANTSDRHNHTNKIELDLITDGDHDIRLDNPHAVDAQQVPVFDFEEYSSSSGGGFILSVQDVLENFDNRIDAIDNGTGTGVTILSEWKFSSTLTATDPGIGKFKYDDIDPTQISNIYLNDFTNTGLDASAILGALKTNDILYIQQKNDSLTGILLTISGSPVDNTGWWTIPVNYDSHTGYLPDNNKVCSVVLSASAGDGHTHTNLTVLDAITNAGSGSIITIGERSSLHTHTNQTELDKLTIGDHDVTIGNPHNTTSYDIPAVVHYYTSSSSSGLGFSVQDALDVLDERVDVLNSLKGEDNTASNQGSSGVGLYITKVGVDLQFKNINAGSNKITVTNDAGNKEVDIDITEANIVHDNLSGSGTYTHAQIDTHLGVEGNAHGVIASDIPAILPYSGSSSSSSGPGLTVQDAIDSLDNRVDYVEVAMDTFQVTGERANPTSNIVVNMGGIAMSSRPFILPYNCTLYAMNATATASATWNAEVHINGILINGAVLSINASSNGYNDNLNVDFNAGDLIEFYCNGTSISQPMITAIFRRR